MAAAPFCGARTWDNKHEVPQGRSRQLPQEASILALRTAQAAGDASPPWLRHIAAQPIAAPHHHPRLRSEEHKSELQSIMRISYAGICLKKKKKNKNKSERNIDTH